MSTTNGNGHMDRGHIDFVALMGPVARFFMGRDHDHVEAHGNELRWGDSRSFCVYLNKGTWQDFKTNEFGNLFALIRREMHYPNDQDGKKQCMKWLADHGFIDPLKQRLNDRIEKTYDYCDSEGKLHYQVVRLGNPKDFRQRRTNPSKPDGWEWKTRDCKPLPYRLPELLEADPEYIVFVVEGEKDVDNLYGVGVIATCNSGGAGKWDKSLSSHLSGRHVVILPDNDEPGEKHANDVARKLTGIATSIRVLHLPGLPNKGDVSDWLAAGGKVDELARMCQEAPVWVEPEPSEKISCKDGLDWLALCDGNKSGPYSNENNTAIAFKNCEQLKNLFAHNTMSRMDMILRAAPGANLPGPYPRPVMDADISAVQCYLQSIGFYSLGYNPVYRAAKLVSLENSFHPIMECLDKLEWDHVSRLDDWLIKYAGAENNEYHKAIGRMFIIAMIARIYQPGCQMNYMLVLEGEQGILKSSLCKAIAGGSDFFSDSLPDLRYGGKDASQHLDGKWIIEIAEMGVFNRAMVEEVKKFITRTHEKFRPSFGREEVIRARSCVFIGTTNQSEYFQDETGNRRMWPVLVKKISLDEFIRDRDQLLAEAVLRYRAGESWWPDREFEAKYIAPQQEDRFEEDAWTNKIAIIVKNENQITVGEIADRLNIPTRDVGTSVQRRIARVLMLIGWERGRRNDAKGTRRWVPGQKVMAARQEDHRYTRPFDDGDTPF